MSFYDAFQLDPLVIKQAMANTVHRKERLFYLKALVLRSFLIVAFSLFFIGLSTIIFGSVVSSLAVVIFCLLLSLRFVDFGYKTSQAVLSLGLILIVLIIAPTITHYTSTLVSFLIHFCSLFSLYALTGHKPVMGNPSLYTFGYVFLAQTPALTWPNFYTLLLYGSLCFLLLATIYWKKHGHKQPDTSFKEVFLAHGWLSKNNTWFLQVALGMSLLFLVAEFSSFKRFMWMGFAASTLLTSVDVNPKERALYRVKGSLIGGILFGLLYLIVPSSLLSQFGPIFGLILGFCASYQNKTIINCLGALLMALNFFPPSEAIVLRLVDNILGVLFALSYLTLSYPFFSKLACFKKSAPSMK